MIRSDASWANRAAHSNTNHNRHPAYTELGFLARTPRRDPGHGGSLSMHLTRPLADVTLPDSWFALP